MYVLLNLSVLKLSSWPLNSSCYWSSALKLEFSWWHKDQQHNPIRGFKPSYPPNHPNPSTFLIILVANCSQVLCIVRFVATAAVVAVCSTGLPYCQAPINMYFHFKGWPCFDQGVLRCWCGPYLGIKYGHCPSQRHLRVSCSRNSVYPHGQTFGSHAFPTQPLL